MDKNFLKNTYFCSSLLNFKDLCLGPSIGASSTGQLVGGSTGPRFKLFHFNW